MQPPGEQSTFFDGEVPVSPEGDRVAGTWVCWSVTPTPTGRPGAGTPGGQQWGRGSGSSTVILSWGSSPKDKGSGFFFKPHQTTGCLNPSPGSFPHVLDQNRPAEWTRVPTCGVVLSPMVQAVSRFLPSVPHETHRAFSRDTGAPGAPETAVPKVLMAQEGPWRNRVGWLPAQ